MNNLSKIAVLCAGVIFLASAIAADDPRIVLRVGEVVATPEDTLVELPVYLDSPLDSLAGVEAYFTIDKNEIIHFASDDTGPDGMLMSADTSGTLLSGWEWVGATSIENTLYDLKVSGMVDWPDKTRRPPIAPQTGGIWAKLIFRIDDMYRMSGDTSFTVTVVPSNSGFSDPFGNTIGIVTSIKRVCAEKVGDSCLVWKNKRVGVLDTSVVKFLPGKINIIDSLGTGR